MGSCLSTSDSEGQKNEDYTQRRRSAHNQRRGELPPSLAVPTLRTACYSDFLCHVCGRYWNSTLSWYNCTQQCKDCMTDVPPRNQRNVRPEDLKKSKGESKEHPMELCQKCREFGYYCGFYNKRVRQVQRGGGRPRRR